MKKAVFLIILFSLFQFQCKEKASEPVHGNKEEVLISNEDSSIVILIDKNNLSGEINNYHIESIFTKSGVLINVYSPKDLSGELSYKINYETKTDSIYPIGSAPVYKYENSEFVETEINTTIDESQKQILLKINDYSKIFVPYLPDLFPNSECNCNCSSASEYIKYIAFEKLKSDIDIIQKYNTSDKSILQCSAIRMLYVECMVGAYFFEDKRYGAKLLFDWLYGTGALNDPVPVQNSLFDQKNSGLQWTDVWRAAAKERASEYYDCSLINKGLSGSIEEKITGSSESSTIGIGKYDFYTKGTYNLSVSPDDEVSYSFNITVQPRDRVDFNLDDAFGDVFTVCGKPFKIIIPDEWGTYLRECPWPLSGNDYAIQGSETSFTFNSSDFPDKNCGYLNGCISVAQGEWEFNIEYNGEPVLSLVKGILSQKDCYVSYDRDEVFAGPLVGTYWSGTNIKQGFSFEGTFNANTANKFTGTLTTSNPVNVFSLIGFLASASKNIIDEPADHAPVSIYSNRNFDLLKK